MCEPGVRSLESVQGSAPGPVQPDGPDTRRQWDAFAQAEDQASRSKSNRDNHQAAKKRRQDGSMNLVEN